MLRVALVTDVDFWRVGTGHRARILALAEYLRPRTEFRVFFLGPRDDVPPSSLGCLADVVQMNNPDEAPHRDALGARLAAALSDWSPDGVVIEYVYLYWVLDVLPSRTRTILDAHDILSSRCAAFRRFGRRSPIEISESVEFALYERFHRVAFIQEDEYQLGCRRLGEERCLLCPHPALGVRRPLRPEVHRIGFLASAAQPNQDAIRWFSNEVVPRLGPAAWSYDIFGTLCTVRGLERACPNVTFRGVVDEVSQFCDAIDIAINPVQYGAGLKIKTIEALGHGVPLVTTRVGAQGLMSGTDRAFLVADSADEFAAAIRRAASSVDLRRGLSDAAHDWANRAFTPDACFGPLLRACQA